MGWSFGKGMTKAEVVFEQTQDWQGDAGFHSCIGHQVRGTTLWSLWSVCRADGTIERYIVCTLLDKLAGYGWGYKSMEEASGPYYHDCPLSYLDTAPVRSESWRKGVRDYHAQRKARKAAAKQAVLNFG